MKWFSWAGVFAVCVGVSVSGWFSGALDWVVALGGFIACVSDGGRAPAGVIVRGAWSDVVVLMARNSTNLFFVTNVIVFSVP